MTELEGGLHALLENHYSVDILTEDQLLPRLGEFPLVVIPEAYLLPEDFRAALLEHVEKGGSLLLIGGATARLFEDSLGVRFEGERERISTELETPEGVMNANGDWERVSLVSARSFAYRHPTRDVRKDAEVAATLTSFGEGKIGAIYGPAATIYFNSHHPYLRRLIGDMAKALFPDPAVALDGPPTLDLALRRTSDGKLCLHLLNVTSVPHSDRYSHTDFIPPVGPVQVRMKVPSRPEQVKWEPEGASLEWRWEDGVLSVSLPQIRVHGALVID
jgi:hypothetical protein